MAILRGLPSNWLFFLIEDNLWKIIAKFVDFFFISIENKNIAKDISSIFYEIWWTFVEICLPYFSIKLLSNFFFNNQYFFQAVQRIFSLQSIMYKANDKVYLERVYKLAKSNRLADLKNYKMSGLDQCQIVWVIFYIKNYFMTKSWIFSSKINSSSQKFFIRNLFWPKISFSMPRNRINFSLW